MTMPPNAGAERDEPTLSGVVPAKRAQQAVLSSTGILETGRIMALESSATTSLGRHPSCALRLADVSVSAVHAAITWMDGQFVLVDQSSTNGTYVNERRLEAPHILQNGDLIRLGPKAAMRFTLMSNDEQEALTRLYETAVYDRVTHVHNRSYLEDRLDAEIAFSVRHSMPLHAVVLDLDHFKHVNDRYGHLAGDAVLGATAAALSRAARTEDLVARFGGEEFVVVLRAVGAHGARAAAERMRRIVEALTVSWSAYDRASDKAIDHELRITASFGVAAVSECASADRHSLLALADRRMYLAKQRGRNCVVGAHDVDD